MPSIHRVIEYSGLNYHQALDLPCDEFLLMAKNSIIDDLMKTEEGRKYLQDCENSKKKEFEGDKLNRLFKGKNKKGKGG